MATPRPGIHDRAPDTWTVRDPAAHARSVRAMFARIAGPYDFMNHLLSLNLDRRWRRRLVARLDADAREVLDLAAGTGDLSVACLRAGRGRRLLVSDFCPEMLVRGRGKGLGAPHRGPDGVERASHLFTADAHALPLPAAACDAVMIAFGARNLADVRAGLREMVRVLRPGGQLLVLEFFRPDPAASGPRRGPSPLLRRWLAATLPLLGHLFAGDGSAYGYLPASMGRFLTVTEFAALLTECGLADIDVERQSLGVAHLVTARAPDPIR
ncbi:MAG: ubiquinone/menaquinone biosynthesis methyltransferase [Candidatus Krumholzibacteriia bacterium]